MASELDKKLKEFRKKSGSESYAKSKYGTITSWISTGDFGLNRLLTGDIYKGVPDGKITQFAGESQTGKSLIAASVVINALKDGYERVFYFDSEGGMTRGFIEQAKVDMEKIEIIPIASIEECHIMMLQVYSMIAEIKKTDPDKKFLCVLDSLGALVPDKVRNDAIKKDRMAGDMGMSAKLKNVMMKAITVPAGTTNTALIVVNHVYDDPSAMYTSKLKNISGGKGAQFMSQIIVQCAKKLEKNEGKKDAEASFNAVVLKFFTVKNRVCKSFYDTELYLDYKNGFHKWFSLFKPAIQMGYIEKKGAWYSVPSYSDKNLRGSDILTNDAIWDTFLDDFNKRSQEELSYSSPEIMDEDSMDEYVDSLVTEAMDEECIEASITDLDE